MLHQVDIDNAVKADPNAFRARVTDFSVTKWDREATDYHPQSGEYLGEEYHVAEAEVFIRLGLEWEPVFVDRQTLSKLIGEDKVEALEADKTEFPN